MPMEAIAEKGDQIYNQEMIGVNESEHSSASQTPEQAICEGESESAKHRQEVNVKINDDLDEICKTKAITKNGLSEGIAESSNEDIPNAVSEGYFEGHYYEVFDVDMTWSEAKAFCESRNAYLATINSEEEQNFLQTICQNGTKNLYWFGLKKNNNEWTWVTGEPLSFTKWAPNEPNSDFNGTEFYAQMYAKKYDGAQLGEWNDSRDNSGTELFYKLTNVGFICETGSIAQQAQKNVRIRFLEQWDAENQIAYFADDTLHLGAAVTEETDTSFLANVDDMVGNYVLAGTRYRDDGMVGSDILLCMESVEAGTGSIQERTEESLTINDTVYPLALKEEYPLFGADKGDQVLYGVQDGQIVALTTLTTQTLHLDSWNPTTKTLELSHELTEYTYTVSRLASEESLAILNADRDPTKSYSIEFACDMVSKVVYGVYNIHEEEYNHEFKIGKDNLSFANSPAYFLTDEEYEEWKKEYSSKHRFQTFFANVMGLWGIPAGIQISDDNIDKLLRGQDNTVRERIQDALNKVWSGSCFGMSVVMANRFVAPGNLPIEKILPGNTSISNTFQLPAPNQSEDVENLINYYQLLYNYNYYWQKEKELADEVKTDYTAAILKLVNQIEDDDIPVLACIATSNVSSAHTVILLDVLETTTDFYRIKVYDPNVTSAFREMTIFRNKPSEDPDNLSKDLENSIRISYSSSSNSETATKQYTCLYNYLASTYEFDIQNYFDENSGYHVPLDDQQLTVLSVPVDTNIQMYAGNSVLNYKDGSVVERSEVYGAYPDVASLAEDGQTTELRFLLADTAEKYNLEVSPAESFASARLEMGTWAVYLSNDTDIVCEVDSTSKTVTVKTDSGEDGSLGAMIVTNDVTEAWPWYAVAIDTENCSELSLSVEEDGVVITGDGLENSTVSVKDDNTVEKQAISITSSEVKLVNTDEGITVTNTQQDHTHILSFVNSADATCNKTGMKAHWHCSECGKDFSDEEGTMEIADVIIPIDPTNHTGGTEIRNKVEATSETEGYTGDTYCLGCGAKISNGNVIAKVAELSENSKPGEQGPASGPMLASQQNSLPVLEQSSAAPYKVQENNAEKAQGDQATPPDEESNETMKSPVVEGKEDESLLHKENSENSENREQKQPESNDALKYLLLVLVVCCVIGGLGWYARHRKKK